MTKGSNDRLGRVKKEGAIMEFVGMFMFVAVAVFLFCMFRDEGI